MKRALLSAALCALFLAVVAPPASATATAHFQGSVLAFSKWGDFDAARGVGSSCSAGTISYSWTFDDGTTATGNPVTKHGALDVTLTVTCSGGNGSATTTRPVCLGFCSPAGIHPDAGYN